MERRKKRAGTRTEPGALTQLTVGMGLKLSDYEDDIPWLVMISNDYSVLMICTQYCSKSSTWLISEYS